MHLLEDVVHHPAALFFGNDDAISLLLGLKITDAEVDDVPRQGQISESSLAIGRGGFEVGLDNLARLIAGARTDKILVAADIAGVGCQARQQIHPGEVELAILQRRIEQPQAMIEIVDQCPRLSLFKRDGFRRRRAVNLQRRAILGCSFEIVLQ